MANSSEIISTAQGFRRNLLAGEKASVKQMTDAYTVAWTQIRSELNVLTAQITQARRAGETVNVAWLNRANRLTTLQEQIEYQINNFAQGASTVIEGQQAEMVELASENVSSIVRQTTNNAVIGLNRLPVQQTQNLIGMLGNGSPLNTILNELAGQGSQGMRDALIKGVSLGWNPRKIERAARQAMGSVLSRALTVARTETLRTYREASRQTYQANSDIIEGWIWLSAADSRTCASCWAMHGTIHKLSEPFGSHPNCRCTQLPIVKGYPLTVPTGDELFAKLSAAKKRAVLGKSYNIYRDGQIDLSDMVHTTRSKQWGVTRRTATPKQALAG